MLNATALGRLLDRLFGVPAGILVGAVLAMAVIVAPVIQVKALVVAERQPAELRYSVLLPMAERFVAPVVDEILKRLRQLKP